jgi:hypothetical protein
LKVRDIVCHGEYLISVIVEQEVIIAEVRAAHVPMKILSLEVKAEDIRKENIECLGDVRYNRWVDIRRSC